jgi:dolichyl-phosphate beta-glucosyltransferase
MMAAAMRLSLIVPAHNEAPRIEQTLRAYRQALGADAEIIVVANSCSDDTAAVTRRVAGALGGIVLIDIPDHVGKGGAVRAGFERAIGEYVGFADADLATPAADLQRVLDAATQSGAAIGSRWAAGSRVFGRTLGRKVASRAFSGLARGLLGLPFRDTQCGVKVFHRRYLAKYLAESRVRDLAFDVELLLLLRESGAKIDEVATAWTAQPGSATLGTLRGFLQHGARMALTILGLWWQRRWRARRRVAGTDS